MSSLANCIIEPVVNIFEVAKSNKSRVQVNLVAASYQADDLVYNGSFRYDRKSPN